MASCDEFPELYFPDSNGEFAWEKPCWNDEWEKELLKDGFKTIEEWNALGKIIKKGEKGKYLPCAKIKVFNESQTMKSRQVRNNGFSDLRIEKYFETHDDAIVWAKENPGRVITRSPKGKGYIAKL